MKTIMSLLIVCLGMSSSFVVAKEDGEAKEKPAAPEPQAMTFKSENEITVQGQRIRYNTTAGTMLMRDKEGKPIAEFGYTAYVKNDTDTSKRPIMFAWNGGPGSASMWLHMGVLEPQRTRVEDI